VSNETTPLAELIKGMIALDGPMPIDRYMDLCLGHPVHGYYMSRVPFGARGDFVTAPEISQMFGELIGAWCCHVWQDMGSPSPLRLIELGPGRGTLMADATRVISRLLGERVQVEVHLVEISPVLRALQARSLDGRMVFWHGALAEVPPGPAVIIGNEFLDALPIRQFVFQGGHWAERVIGLDAEGELVPGLVPCVLGPDVHVPETPSEGMVIEYSPAQAQVAALIGRRIAEQGGAALLIDYGHVRSAAGDTLQAVRTHQFVPILDRPGESDLTAHVDFEMIGRLMKAAGAEVAEPLTQREFLIGLGLTQRAERLKSSANERQKMKIDSDVERLTDDRPTGMGRLFKVLAARHRSLPLPPPFSQ